MSKFLYLSWKEELAHARISVHDSRAFLQLCLNLQFKKKQKWTEHNWWNRGCQILYLYTGAHRFTHYQHRQGSSSTSSPPPPLSLFSLNPYFKHPFSRTTCYFYTCVCFWIFYYQWSCNLITLPPPPLSLSLSLSLCVCVIIYLFVCLFGVFSFCRLYLV